MGWFGDRIRSIGRAIGRGVEWVGEKTGIRSLEKAGKAIQEACGETSRRTGRTGEYDQNTASERETANIADILSGFSLGLKTQAQEIEQQARREVEEYFDQLIAAMSAVLGDTAAIRNLKSQKWLIVQGIDNRLTTVLAQRVSLTDQECLSILKMSAGAEKERKMDAFGRKVIREGLEALCSSLDRAFSGVCSSIGEELNALAEQERRNLQSLVDQLRKITDKRVKDAGNKEEAMLMPAQKLAASDLILELIDEKETA